MVEIHRFLNCPFSEGRKGLDICSSPSHKSFFSPGAPLSLPQHIHSQENVPSCPHGICHPPQLARPRGCPPSQRLRSGSRSPSSALDILVLFKYLQQAVVKKIETLIIHSFTFILARAVVFSREDSSGRGMGSFGLGKVVEKVVEKVGRAGGREGLGVAMGKPSGHVRGTER